jgi:DNA-binding XRE family transcriptional regulator
MSTIIPPELVPLLRDGLYFDLQGQLERAERPVSARERQDPRSAVTQALADAEGTRALLDVVGWVEDVNAPENEPVVIRGERHRPALLRGLRERIASDTSAAEDEVASDTQRARARTRLEGLTAILRPVEEDDRELVSLGRAVRRVREEKGLDVRELADAIPHVTQRRLEAIEAGRSNPPFSILVAIGEGLGVRPQVLYQRAEATEDQP